LAITCRVSSATVSAPRRRVSFLTEDQDDLLPFLLAKKAVKEVDEHRGDEFLLEDPELQVALVGDRRDHVRAEALAGALDHRRAAGWRPRAPGGVVGAQSHLIGPQNQGFLAVSAGLDLRVALIQPARDQLRVLLKRAASGLLRAEPPGAQIPPGGLLRDPDPKAPVDQLAHQRPGPEKPRQPQLIGILLTDSLGDLRPLPRHKSRLLTRPATTLARRQRPIATQPVRPHPLTD
jgi:hypothetical protein